MTNKEAAYYIARYTKDNEQNLTKRTIQALYIAYNVLINQSNVYIKKDELSNLKRADIVQVLDKTNNTINRLLFYDISKDGVAMFVNHYGIDVLKNINTYEKDWVVYIDTEAKEWLSDIKE